MALRLILYPLVFVLVYGSGFYSISNHSPTFCSFGERIGRDNFVFIDSDNVIDFIEKAFPYIIVENSTESNDDDSNGDKVLDPGSGLPSGWSLPFANSLRITRTAPDLLWSGRQVPLYLLNRVFRI